MKANIRIIPIFLVGGLLLVACASTLTATPPPTTEGVPDVIPSDTPVPQEVSQADPTESVVDDLEPSPSAAHPQPTATQAEEDEDYNFITLLPPDAIPAIFSPEFLPVEAADLEYDTNEQVMGVVFDGEARAYSIGHLSSHEIVNDTVGGRKIAVTW